MWIYISIKKMALTVRAFILEAEGGHVLRVRVRQQQSDAHGRAPLHCWKGQQTVKKRISMNI